MKKAISLLLCMILCLGLCIPALAYNDDVTVSAKLDQATLNYDADKDQTVELTVTLSKEVQLFSVYMEADVPDTLTLSGISSDVPFKEDEHYSLSTGIVSWYAGKNVAATTLVILTVTVPKGTAAGSYKIGVKEIELATEGENGDNNWMEGGTAYATLKIKEPAATTYTVKFDANGGTGSMDSVKVEAGKKLTLPDCGFTAPDGKEFDTWDAGDPGTEITVTKNMTVKALWKDKTVTTYTVKFDANGGTGSMDSVKVEAGKTLKLPQNGFTAPEGQQFKAWSIDGKEYAAGKTITVNKNITAKAVWEKIPAATFTVSFDANGGTGTMADVKVEEGSDYTLPECGFTAPEGQQYKAWGLGSNELQPGDVYRIDADTTFIALWEEIPELVTVRFHLNGGKATGITDGKEVTYYADEEGDPLPRATKSGYNFDGWFDAAKGGKRYSKVAADLPANLYAQWSEYQPEPTEDTITVSFRLIGAELATQDVDLGAKEYMPDYVTWVSTTRVELEEGATVYDLWVKATAAAGITSVGASKNYVSTVYAPTSLGGYALSEFTNGRRSGWMYTINGKHPGYGLKDQKVHDGDRVIWHYVNDYSYEVDDWAGDAQYPSLGDGKYWNRWLLAPDSFGGKGGGLGGKKDAGPEVKGSTITVTPEVKDGVADAAVDADTVKEALKNTRKGGTLTVVVDSSGADRVALALPADAVKAMANSEVNLRVETENGTAKLDVDAVSKLAGTGKDIEMTVKANSDGTTTFDVAAGGRSVDAKVKVELPAGSGQVLAIVKPNGTQEIVKKSIVENGKVYAEIPAGAKVKIIRNEKSFSDVSASAWYKGAVDFASSHELFNGVSDTEFAPSMPMTRAMLATVLFRLEGAVAAGSNSFADVPNDTWYTDAVTWANANGIMMGTDKGFEPNVNITREQIATMLFRYAKLLGLDTSGRSALNGFTDGEKTSSWASEAMQWAVSAGLFKGDNTNALNPKGDATRAEVATLMQRLVGLIVK